MNVPRYVNLANPDGKRWQAYQSALFGFWKKRGVEPNVLLIPWRDVVPRFGQLDELLSDDAPAICRLESPGRDQEVMQLLLEAGDESCRSASRMQDEHIAKSALIHPGQLHRGFCRTLTGLRETLDRRKNLIPLACPLAVAELFDKTTTSQRLVEADLPCPHTLHPPRNASQLIDQLRSRNLKTAYVKLNAGSSATGIAVVHALDDPPWAITSMLRVGDTFHNTRKLQRITGEKLDEVLSFLLHEGAFIQEGIPMAQIDGQNFDVRVVVIHGAPAFTIFRLSSLPMTNLHLGGRRGRWHDCRAAIPTRAWLDALDHCVDAAKLYACASVGVDLVFERGFARHYILEINAFGDFFPGLTDVTGRSVHETEIMKTAQKVGLLPPGD
jgi:glutathione synthase/RimK-type ligase-like ATP-grasp enzyme